MIFTPLTALLYPLQQDTTITPAANNFAWRVQEFLDAFEPDGKH